MNNTMTDETANTLRVLALILIFAGVLMLGYGAYAYASERSDEPAIATGPLDDVGSVATRTLEDRNVSLPVVGGIVCLLAGAIMLYMTRETLGFPRTPHTPGT